MGLHLFTGDLVAQSEIIGALKKLHYPLALQPFSSQSYVLVLRK